MAINQIIIAPPKSIVTDGLILHLDAGNTASYPGSGTTWNDLSSTGANATLINGPTYTSNNGGTIDFDGSNDYVNATNAAIDSAYRTIDVWFKCDNPNAAASQQIYATTYASAGSFNIIQLGGFSYYNFSFRLSSNSQYGIGTAAGSKTTNWINVVGTYNGSSGIVYRNGTQENQINVGGTLRTSSPTINIGRQTTGAAYFDGNISSVKVYNRALTSTEVTQNFEALRARYGV